MAKAPVNPYKEAWDKVEDHEASLSEMVNNGVLFEPSYEDLARRHVSSSKALLRKARALGATTDGKLAFKEALFHRDMAENFYAKRDEINHLSR